MMKRKSGESATDQQVAAGGHHCWNRLAPLHPATEGEDLAAQPLGGITNQRTCWRMSIVSSAS